MDWKKLKNNQKFWQIFKLREKIVDTIRRFFKKEGFLEIQTPILSPFLIPESYLEVFETELSDKLGRTKPAFLTTSPELWHKKLLAAGSGNIFEITKSFRNTDFGGALHNPEFTMLEWYRVNCDYQKTIEDCEKLIGFLVSAIGIGSGEKKIIYQGKEIDPFSPFEKITVAEAFEKYAPGKNPFLLSQEDFSLIYVEKIEPNLGWGKPTIIYNYPAKYAPLAKTSRENPEVKERFELYLGGVELADGYSELTDEKEQRKEFEKEILLRKKLGKKEIAVDYEFLKALESGLPNCSGVALGIDRLVAVLLDKTDLKEVILFAGEEVFDF